MIWSIVKVRRGDDLPFPGLLRGREWIPFLPPRWLAHTSSPRESRQENLGSTPAPTSHLLKSRFLFSPAGLKGNHHWTHFLIFYRGLSWAPPHHPPTTPTPPKGLHQRSPSLAAASFRRAAVHAEHAERGAQIYGWLPRPNLWPEIPLTLVVFAI